MGISLKLLRKRKLTSSAEALQAVGELEAEIREATLAEADAMQRRTALIATGEPEEIRKLEQEAADSRLRAEQAAANRVAMKERLAALLESERLERLNAAMADNEKAWGPYVQHAVFLSELARPIIESRAAVEKEDSRVAATLPHVTPLAFDLGALQSASPRVQPPAALFESEAQASRAHTAFKRNRKGI